MIWLIIGICCAIVVLYFVGWDLLKGIWWLGSMFIGLIFDLFGLLFEAIGRAFKYLFVPDRDRWRR